jgi:hypothetical protein
MIYVITMFQNSECNALARKFRIPTKLEYIFGSPEWDALDEYQQSAIYAKKYGFTAIPDPNTLWSSPWNMPGYIKDHKKVMDRTEIKELYAKIEELQEQVKKEKKRCKELQTELEEERKCSNERREKIVFAERTLGKSLEDLRVYNDYIGN